MAFEGRVFGTFLLAFALLPSLTLTQNGNCGPTNTNDNCQLGAYPQDGTTVYYAPNDQSDIKLYAQAYGSCDAGSQADVSFYETFGDNSNANLLADCGCLPLDGNIYTVDCAGMPRNLEPEGSYHFVINARADAIAEVRFSITHTQQTSTAATPTSTVTTYTTETDTTTTTSTETDTSTLDAFTVTTPAGTTDLTSTVTPAPTTRTITQTQTITIKKDKFTYKKVTKTSTAPCHPLKTCPSEKKNPPHRFEARPTNSKRQAPDPQSANGDGPLTTTVTPDPVYVTETDDGGTTTETDTSFTTTTTTVAAIPPTVTVASGTESDTTTTTLPRQTSTRTAHTTKKVTSTKTIVITFTTTKHTTPVCTAKSTKKAGH